jgi:hypothetical protein
MSLRKLFPITSLDDSVSSTPSDYATPSSIISRFKDWCGFAVNISRGIVVGLDTKECFVLPDSIVSDKKSSAQRRSFELEPYLPIAAESMVVASLRSASNNDRLILIADRDRIQSAIDRYEANGHWIGAISCTSFIALQHAVETSFLNRTCNVMWKRDDDSWEFFAIQDGVPTAWQWLNLDSIPNDIWFENPSEDIASIPMIVIGQIDHEMEEKLLEYFGHIDVRPSRAIEEFAEQSAHRILSGESTPWFDLRRKPVVTLESIAPLRWSLLTFCIVLWLALIASSAIVLLRSWVLAAQTDDHEKAQVALFQELFPQQSIPVDIPGRLRSELRQSNADPPSPFETRIEGASLVILTTEQFHQQIARILPQFDSRETSTKQSPIRFYKIKNVPVQDISETLNSLQGGFGVSPFQNGRSKANSQQRARGLNNVGDPQPNNPFANMTAQGQQPGQLPFNPYNGLANQQYLGQPNSFLGNQIQNGFDQSGFQSPSNPFAYPVSGFPSYALPATNINQRAIQSPLGSAQVTADLGSNTLIIIAEPEVQQAYQQLIDFLDKRRPQVMIEARIVIIDTTDDYTLGVEVSGGDRFGAKKLFAFSSYGLSTVNPTTGSLAINPGTGFNATLVDPSTADVVVRALAAHKRARVLSAPKILVDDNAEGMLESVNEIPYTSVNASQTVATTSFAGFAKAGTSITVTPTISQGKHVNLDYVVTLNSFTGTGSTGISTIANYKAA